MNVHYGHRNHELEKVLKEQAQDDSCFVEVNGQRVYLPSANLHALFLLRHALSHFAAVQLILRQALDWGFFIEKHTDEIDWAWLHKVMAEFKMTRFFCCLNAICVEDLGFDSRIFPEAQFKDPLKERVLNDILAPEFDGPSPKKRSVASFSNTAAGRPMPGNRIYAMEITVIKRSYRALGLIC